MEIKMDSNNFQQHAINYAMAGYKVLPLKARSKIPYLPGGVNLATNDVELIKHWWENAPEANIGLATGQKTPFWVLDIDGPEGEANFKELELTHGSFLQTLQVRTGGGGRHLYFAIPPNTCIKNSVSSIAPKIDVRGNGGYVVAPPSLHESGERYVFVPNTTNQFSYAPEWLLRLASNKSTTQTTGTTEWLKLLKGVNEGERNNTLARIAGKLLQANMSPEMALELCIAWNSSRCSPPLSNYEVVKTVDSIAKAELDKLRGTHETY